MQVEIYVPHEYAQVIVDDAVEKMGAQILEINHSEQSELEYLNESHISVVIALSKMLGYAARMRSLTRGSGSFSQRFLEYQPKYD